ncbi:MAG: PqqD family protein [Gemmatimonadetes bacterium]|nr:PqqD family protein [Gemmatimonadota bacterium]
MKPETRLGPNTADVAAKVIDGEAIIMNLANGLYFSMDEVGSAVWEMVEAGFSLGEMSDRLQARYDADRETIAGDVNRIAQQLLDEGLVVETEADAPLNDGPGGDGGGGSYAAPTLNRYDDMADLLALDPPMPGLGALPE